MFFSIIYNHLLYLTTFTLPLDCGMVALTVSCSHRSVHLVLPYIEKALGQEVLDVLFLVLTSSKSSSWCPTR